MGRDPGVGASAMRRHRKLGVEVDTPPPGAFETSMAHRGATQRAALDDGYASRRLSLHGRVAVPFGWRKEVPIARRLTNGISQMTFAISNGAAMRTQQSGVPHHLIDALMSYADFEAPTSVADLTLRRQLLRC